MNRHPLLIAFIMALSAFSSCQEELIDDGCQFTGEEITITAYSHPETRTTFVDGEDGKQVNWTAGDKISLFFNQGENGGSRFTTAEGGAVASFTGTITAVSGSLSNQGGTSYFWGLYPYDSSASCDGTYLTTSLQSVQSVPAGNVADDLLVTVGRSENLSLYFRNTLSVVGIKVSQSGIEQIIFSGNNNECLAGEYRISFDGKNPVAEPTDYSTRKIVVKPSGTSTFSPGEVYYFAFLPGTFSKGYSVEFVKANGYSATYTRNTSFTFPMSMISTMTNKDQGLTFKSPVPEMVDLGLSVKWATFNVGASYPEDYGDYFAWGETEGRTNGDGWTSYYYCNKSWTSPLMTKYCTNSQWGDVDNLTRLEYCDDAAYINWGDHWRMPTRDEQAELRTQCTWTWTSRNGVKGYLVTSNVAGYTDRSIFLPAAGYVNSGDSSCGRSCFFWSSDAGNAGYAYAMYFGRSTYDGVTYSDVIEERADFRYWGFPVRAVYDPSLATDEKPVLDLSSTGTANCYVVSKAGRYRFLTVKGNSSDSVGDVDSVEILWESYGTSSQPSVGDLVNFVALRNGYITFDAGSLKGNALIAAKDASDNVLWSWHIWMTDTPEEQVYRNNAGTMMDRNLGATLPTPGNVRSIGLLYQWGRKDPFVGGSQISYSAWNNQERAKSTMSSWEYVSSDASTGTVEYATAHPTTFIGEYSSSTNWLCGLDSLLWSNNKTVYDPCPVGYKVPEGGPDGVWAKAFGDSALWTNTSGIDSNNRGVDFASADKTLSVSSSVWYPASGYLSHGSLYETGRCGSWWTSTNKDANHSYTMSVFSDGSVAPSWENSDMSRGYSVRCVKE